MSIHTTSQYIYVYSLQDEWDSDSPGSTASFRLPEHWGCCPAVLVCSVCQTAVCYMHGIGGVHAAVHAARAHACD